MFTPCQHQHKHNTAELAQCLHLASINTNTIQLSWLNVYTLPASTQTQYSWAGWAFTPCHYQHKHCTIELAQHQHKCTTQLVSINTNTLHSLSASTQTHYTACQHQHNKHNTIEQVQCLQLVTETQTQYSWVGSMFTTCNGNTNTLQPRWLNLYNL